MKKIKEFIKEEKKLLISLLISFLIFEIPLPYYVDAPGGVININDRISNGNEINGSLNMLYVSEYRGNVGTVLTSLFMPNWDLEKKSEKQVSNESVSDIEKRDKIMLHNSIQNATFAAYNYADKEIDIKSYEHSVIATTKDNGIKIGDIILEVNDEKMESFSQLKEIIQNTEVGNKIKLKIKRNKKEKIIYPEVIEEDDSKIIGAVIITNYEYELNPDIEISFKGSESGSSGGLMMALSIYNVISGNDLVRGRNIAGTGTIDNDGNVGEIDGIKYKLMGAIKSDMDIVLVPKDNYKEAMKVKKEKKYDIEIVSVSTLEDAINYLEK